MLFLKQLYLTDNLFIYVLSINIGQCSCIYSRTSTNGHLSTTVTFFVPADRAYICCCLNLSTTDSSLQRQRPLKRVPITTKKKNLDNGQYSQLLMKTSRMVIKFDSYGTSFINRDIGILIVFHLYCCSKNKLATILISNVVILARFVSLTF